MANTVTTSVLGVVFWAGASRRYSPRRLGEDAALISAMILLSTVAQLNLSMGIPRLLPQVRERRWRPVLGAYAVTSAVAVAVTVSFLALVPRLSPGFAFLGNDPALGFALVGAVVLWNVFALQDAVLTAARWALAVPIENGLFGLLKIVLMVRLANGVGGHGVFVAWLLAMALLLLPVNGLIFGRVLPSRRGPARGPPTTALPLAERGLVARYLATDYVAALLSQGSTALLPLLVIGVLGREENAYFYVSSLIAGAVGALAQSLSTSLVVEGAHEESDLASFTTRSVRRYATVVVPGVILAIVAAPLVLAPFGPDYGTRGTTVLRLLLAGTVPQAVVTLYLGVERVRANVKRVLAVEGATVLLVISGAIVGMRWYGLAGVGSAWLAAQAAMAVLVVPRLWSVVSGGHSHSERQAKLRERRGTLGPGRPRPARPVAFPSAVDLVDLGAAVVTVALVLLAALGVTGAVPTALALVFLTFVPGWAVLDYVGLVDSTARVALAVALSLSLSSGAALSSFWLHLWHPRPLLYASAALSLVALLSHLARLGFRRSPARGGEPREAPLSGVPG
jgi:O-antigen/teichoic acid export membrane protein